MAGDLFCSEDSVTRITKTRADVSIFVQAAIQVPNVDLNVRMSLVKTLHTFRSSDDAHKFNAFASVLIDEINGRTCGTAGC